MIPTNLHSEKISGEHNSFEGKLPEVRYINDHVKVKWVYNGKFNKDVRVYYLVDSKLYHTYKDDRNNPDYVPGMENEPYVLWVIQSGFDDLFHTIVESGEMEEPVYCFLTSKQIKERFKITLKE